MALQVITIQKEKHEVCLEIFSKNQYLRIVFRNSYLILSRTNVCLKTQNIVKAFFVFMIFKNNFYQ